MQEKMKKPSIRIFLGIFLTMLTICVPPHRAQAASGIEQISLGFEQSAVLEKDGTLWMWGDNFSGQLGNGSSANSRIPVQIILPGYGKTDISECEISLPQTKYTYTGKAIKPLPTVTYNGKTLKDKTDYNLS